MTEFIRLPGTKNARRRLTENSFRGTNRLKRLFRLLDVGIVILDASLEPEIIGRGACELLGVNDPEDAVARWRLVVEKLDLDELAEEQDLDLELQEEPDHDTAGLADEDDDADDSRDEAGEAHDEGDEPAGEKAEPEKTEPWIQRLRVQLHRFEEDGDPWYLCLLRDRQLIESLDEDLRQADRLRSLNRLYLGVAHDLKAPLNALGLHVQLVEGSIGAEAVEDKQRRWLGVIKEELARLQRALVSLLDQTAPSESEERRFEVGDVLREIENLVTPQARQHGIAIEVSAPEPGHTTARRDQIKQAILSLVINAIEAIGEYGTIRLELDESMSSEHEGVRVRVRDNGPGIPASLRSRIFDMRFTTKDTGTGIGLHVARRIVRAHGGDLRLLDSGEGGTTFELRLRRT